MSSLSSLNTCLHVSPELFEAIDLVRYPIHECGSEALNDLIRRCRKQLQEQGAVSLPGFVKADAIRRDTQYIVEHIHEAYFKSAQHTVYMEPPDFELDHTHPRRHELHTSYRTFAYDLLSQNLFVRRLYEWDAMTAFICGILDEENLYRHGDPLAALNVHVHSECDEVNWHFDRSLFSTTLLLQKPSLGGHFEYVPFIRNADFEAYDEVQKIIQGQEMSIRYLPMDAGSLNIFAGRYSLHRVTKIFGATPRMIAVLTYETEPNVTFDNETRQWFYGREI